MSKSLRFPYQLMLVRGDFLNLLQERTAQLSAISKLQTDSQTISSLPPTLSATRPTAHPLFSHPEAPLHPLKRLLEALEFHGFTRQGVLGTLKTVERGRDLIHVMTPYLPDSWDLLDAFEGLNLRFREADPRYKEEEFDFYGPWAPVGRKDVNATLRSLGMFHERWEGSKEAALLHPHGNRANPVIQSAALVKMGKVEIIEALRPTFPWELVLPRLQVESAVIDLYLNRPDWLGRLRPDLDAPCRTAHFDEIWRLNEQVRASVHSLLEYFAQRESSPG